MPSNKLAELGETPVQEAIADHECNPEYEVHLGQVVENNGVLRGMRRSGYRAAAGRAGWKSQ